MNSRILLLFPIILLTACVTSSVQPLTVPNAILQTPIQLKKLGGRTIALANPTSSIKHGTVISTYAVGIYCARNYKVEWSEKSLGATAIKRYNIILSEELLSAKYNLFGDINDPFYDVRKKKSDYLLGATFVDQKLNSCIHKDRQEGEAYLNIQWQLYDVKNQKIVYSKHTEGWTNTTIPKISLMNNMRYVAYRHAVQNLLADEKFAELAGK